MENNKKTTTTITFLLILFTILMSAQTKVRTGYIRKYSRWIIAEGIRSPRDYGTNMFCKKC